MTTLGVDNDPVKLVGRNVAAAKPLGQTCELRERCFRLRVLGENARPMKAIRAVDVRLDDVERGRPVYRRDSRLERICALSEVFNLAFQAASIRSIVALVGPLFRLL